MKHAPIPAIKQLSAPEIAQWLVSEFGLAKAGEILAALCDEIEAELQNGWLTEGGEIAEGSLEGDRAGDACRAFKAYLESLHHASEGGPENYACGASAPYRVRA